MNKARTIGRRLAFGTSFVVVAVPAAVNSYAHMRDLAILGHQAELLASILPLSIDGLLVIASLAMAEDKAQNRHPRLWARFGFWFGAVISLVANVASTAVHHGDPLSIGVAAWPPLVLLIVTEIMARPGKPKDVQPPAAVQTVVPVAQAAPVPQPPAAVPTIPPAAPVAQAAPVVTVAAAAPVSPGMPPVAAPTTATVKAVIEEDPRALAFREAQRHMRATGRI